MLVEVWTLVTDTDCGFEVFVFATESEAYVQMIATMRRDSNLDAEDLAKLENIEASSDWDELEEFRSKLCERMGWLDRFDVEQHALNAPAIEPAETGGSK